MRRTMGKGREREREREREGEREIVTEYNHAREVKTITKFQLVCTPQMEWGER